jgi:SAM-dependent methyltransferase
MRRSITIDGAGGFSVVAERRCQRARLGSGLSYGNTPQALHARFDGPDAAPPHADRFAAEGRRTMGRDIINETPEIWGKEFSTESNTVERDYDKFAETGNYDETFAEWDYVGPETAAAITRNYVPLSSTILDAACGSGLTGTALKNLGYRNIDGMDISGKLLELAKQTGAYASLKKVDMQVMPLPIDDDTYDAVNFIGALTYFETSDILKELCRIVRPRGHVIFSQRDDIMRERNYGENLREIAEAGLWRRVFGTEPMPYLPNHPEYGTKIKVRYFVYEVL